MPHDREALFISHANPEDNAFALWLGAKLAAMGYEVWADVMRLHGGADWSRDLERALREQAIKLLAVCTPTAVEKDGVRNEIEIASQLAKQLNDPEFIIPLRLKAYESPFRIARTQYVDFSDSWAAGLAEVVDLLSTTYKIPKKPGRSVGPWLASLSRGATRLIQRRERLTSNWLRLQTLPSTLHYCEPPSGFPLSRFQERTLHRWPIVPFGAGVLTFAAPEAGVLGPDMPARSVVELPVREFLKDGWIRLGIQGYEARRHFADLGNQAFEAFLHKRGLIAFEGSNGRRAWWGDVRTVPLAQVHFNWQHQKGRRQIVGKSDKRDVFWHYAVMGNVRTAPVRHMRISARLIFSENGMDAIGDSKRMHRLRRSFARGWRNARWRDMLLAFLWWLAEADAQIALPVSAKQKLVWAVPPLSFASAVSVVHAGEEPPDEDDPDIEVDDWDEEEDPSATGEPGEEAAA
ncbi:MAG: toll/interleukin-1 receptor domain-containing protein [Burkholderiales bacterium]|nr:toll/interleukin-1 receptor domain-containing protein [Burkholderiales bacterium]